MAQSHHFRPGAAIHIYQKGRNGQVLFYSIQDLLVYYTIFSTKAQTMGVHVLSLCLMINHVHALIQTTGQDLIRRFDTSVESVYAREFNKEARLKGQVFKRNFGWAVKTTDKAVRSCLAYIANNPVEAHLGKTAYDSRWNFLKYARSRNPYSKPHQANKCPKRFRQRMDTVDRYWKAKKYIGYELMNKLFQHLDKEDCQRLADHIISTYLVIDFHKASSYFGSFDNMLAFFSINTGKEYDLAEEWSREGDNGYLILAKEMAKMGAGKSFLRLSEPEKRQLGRLLTQKTIVSDYQVARFLHYTPSIEY